LSELLSSRAKYEHFLYTLVAAFPEIEKSTLHFITTSATAGVVKGTLSFRNGFELHVVEVIDFAAEEILDYSYTVFRGEEKVQWYDPQPHVEDASLAENFPHHMHEHPDIRHNRKPAPTICFKEANLPILIEMIEKRSWEKTNGQ